MMPTPVVGEHDRTPDPARLIAIGALLAGWLAGSVAVFAFEGLLVEGMIRVPDMLWFTAIIGLFAAVGWLVSVLPIALLADHRHWFFRPAFAPFVGAASGAALLLLETWVFFGVAPWDYFSSPRFGDAYLMTVALLVGAVVWTVYTAAVRWWHPASRATTRAAQGDAAAG
jgi:hypothetical protein